MVGVDLFGFRVQGRDLSLRDLKLGAIRRNAEETGSYHVNWGFACRGSGYKDTKHVRGLRQLLSR